jgi:hypothetical protein
VFVAPQLGRQAWHRGERRRQLVGRAAERVLVDAVELEVDDLDLHGLLPGWWVELDRKCDRGLDPEDLLKLA